MDVEFADKSLALIETDEAAKTGLPVSVITSFRDKFVLVRAAADERVFRNWKSLHYEKLEGYKDNRRSIRLNKQWRVVFTINTGCSPNKIKVLAVEDYH
ncbi:MAG TPA: type II toxin-antitoxin system RelE/ParE family toxin [Candidatus Saccharimonadales bacterium]|nr:type II toxin-antitoxin system RelE/ParE family toxin [Candidatus Saccharimonadales bacterium]